MAGDHQTKGQGRRITKELMISNCTTTRRRGMNDDKYLLHVTHLHLNGKNIRSLEGSPLSEAPGVKVLYLYENRIDRIIDLDKMYEIESLFLEQNNIRVMEGIPCRRLTKLMLDRNEICRVEGLESAACLRELHVANQSLQDGQALTFAGASITGIMHSLEILNVSGNNISNIEPLLDLVQLRKLNMAKNAVEDMASVVDLLTTLDRLEDLDLRGNPICAERKYYERAVTRSGRTLQTFDGRKVEARHREMLKSIDMHTRKVRQVEQANAAAAHMHGRDEERHPARPDPSALGVDGPEEMTVSVMPVTY